MVTAGNSSADDLGSLRLEIGRTDVLDDRQPNSVNATGNGGRCDRTRLPIGYFQLEVRGKVLGGSMRLSLWDAQLSGEIRTSLGIVNWTAITHATTDLNLLNYKASGGEVATFAWHARQGDSVWASQCHQKTGAKKQYVGNPAFEHSSTPNSHINVTEQPLWSGSRYATAFATRIEPDGSRTLITSTSAPLLGASRPARATATGLVKVGQSLGWAGLLYGHRRWWHDFYPASFVSMSDSKLEAFYWAQIYKLASATRGDKPGPSFGAYDHTGPWFVPSDTCCPLFNLDMNLPVQYQLILASNHPDLGYSLARGTALPSYLSVDVVAKTHAAVQLLVDLRLSARRPHTTLSEPLVV